MTGTAAESTKRTKLKGHRLEASWELEGDSTAVAACKWL